MRIFFYIIFSSCSSSSSIYIYFCFCFYFIHLGLLLSLDDLLSWQHVLLVGLGVLQFFCIEVLNAGYELILLLLLLDSCR